MPDYDPNRGTGQGPTRRAVTRPPKHYGPGGLPTEGADPAPKPWPIAPWLGLIVLLGLLALQLWPATHYRHPRDPRKNWYPIEFPPGDERNIEAAKRHFAPTMEAYRKKHGRIEVTDEFAESGLGVDLAALDRINENPMLRKRRTQHIEIFLCTDEKDLRPLVVLINSTISNARHPERLKFNLIIPTSESNVEYYKLTSFFPFASIEIISEGIDLGEISKLIKYREDSHARKELTSPYNFLPYYLPRLRKDIERILYLDTDIVVKGDIEELYMTHLEGHPAAAVKDCSQHYQIYFDFDQLKEIQAREGNSKPWLPKEPFDEQECVFNRGTLLIDVQEWIQQNVTEAIEFWMEEYNNAEKVLYTYGLSQPPFLLALYKKFKELDHSWNIRGLGRDHFSKLEQDFYEAAYHTRPESTPFVSLESDYAKILHFNGEFKPWKRGRQRLDSENVVSLCGTEGHECYKLWWEYLSPKANEAFKHTPGKS